MAGDIISLTKNKDSLSKERIDALGGNNNASTPIGERSSIFYNENLDGIPRRADLFSIRLLGQSTQIEWLKDIIKHQVASTDFKVQPDVPEGEEPDQRQVEAANEIQEFLSGNFNTDNQGFDDLLKIILDDVLDFDSGILELVRDNEGYLDQLITRDGLTFTKNVNDTGLQPQPDGDEPAYYQFSPAAYAQTLYSRDRRGIDVRDIQDELGNMPFTRFVNRESIPFSRDQIVWFQENPVSYEPYGRGRTRKKDRRRNTERRTKQRQNSQRHRRRIRLQRNQLLNNTKPKTQTKRMVPKKQTISTKRPKQQLRNPKHQTRANRRNRQQPDRRKRVLRERS